MILRQDIKEDGFPPYSAFTERREGVSCRIATHYLAELSEQEQWEGLEEAAIGLDEWHNERLERPRFVAWLESRGWSSDDARAGAATAFRRSINTDRDLADRAAALHSEFKNARVLEDVG